jgi:hypothetical protein
LRAAVAAVLDGLELATDRPSWRPSLTLRGLERLPIVVRS